MEEVNEDSRVTSGVGSFLKVDLSGILCGGTIAIVLYVLLSGVASYKKQMKLLNSTAPKRCSCVRAIRRLRVPRPQK